MNFTIFAIIILSCGLGYIFLRKLDTSLSIWISLKALKKWKKLSITSLRKSRKQSGHPQNYQDVNLFAQTFRANSRSDQSKNNNSQQYGRDWHYLQTRDITIKTGQIMKWILEQHKQQTYRTYVMNLMTEACGEPLVFFCVTLIDLSLRERNAQWLVSNGEKFEIFANLFQVFSPYDI